MSISYRQIEEALAAYQRIQPTLGGHAAEISYRLAEVIRELTKACARCGGDGVFIDDDAESTRQIITTCEECRGVGVQLPTREHTDVCDAWSDMNGSDCTCGLDVHSTERES